MEAERDVIQLKKIQFMQDKVGQVYDGFVSGVTGSVKAGGRPWPLPNRW